MTKKTPSLARRRSSADTPPSVRKALTSTVESMTAVRTSGMMLPVFLYLSGNLLFLYLRCFGSGSLLGMHALHHLDDAIPCLLAVYNSLGFEHNGLVFNRGFQNITHGYVQSFPQLSRDGHLKFFFHLHEWQGGLSSE